MPSIDQGDCAEVKQVVAHVLVSRHRSCLLAYLQRQEDGFPESPGTARAEFEHYTFEFHVTMCRERIGGFHFGVAADKSPV